MTPKQPQPAAASGADAHRDEEQSERDAVPAAPAEPTDRGGGGGGGGGQPPASGGSGATAGIPVKKIAVAAGVMLAAYMLWRLAKQSDAVNVDSGGGRDRQQSDSRTDDEGPRELEDGRVVDAEGNPIIPDDENDPLKADHEAGRWLFSNWGE